MLEKPKSSRGGSKIHSPHQRPMQLNSPLTYLLTFSSFVVSVNVQRFDTEDEFLQSQFWRAIAAQKNPTVAANTVIQIQNGNRVLHFAGSEITNNGFSGMPDWIYKRNVELMEVDYGKVIAYSEKNVPISRCISTRFSSSGGTHSLSFKTGQKLSILVDPKISVSLALVGATVSTGINALDITTSLSTSITCTIPSGQQVQVMSSRDFLYFPEAKKRPITYIGKLGKFGKVGKWENMESDYTTQGKISGVLLFDSSLVPSLECVSLESEQKCNELHLGTIGSESLNRFLEMNKHKEKDL